MPGLAGTGSSLGVADSRISFKGGPSLPGSSAKPGLLGPDGGWGVGDHETCEMLGVYHAFDGPGLAFPNLAVSETAAATSSISASTLQVESGSRLSSSDGSSYLRANRWWARCCIRRPGLARQTGQ